MPPPSISRICAAAKYIPASAVTLSGLCLEIQKSIETAYKEKLVSEYGLQDRETESGDTRVDKLFQDREHENSPTEDRRTFTNPHENSHMETMEEEN